MKFDKKVLLAGLVAPALLALTAQAAEPGFYIGAGAGQSSLEADTNSFTPVVNPLGATVRDFDIDETDSAWKGFIGYQFSEWLGVEVGYVELGSVDDEVTVGTTRIEGDLDAGGWEGYVVGSFPLTENFDLFAKLGGFTGDVDFDGDVRFANGTSQHFSGETDGDSAFAYGLGAAWNFGDGHWSLRGEYTEYDADRVDDLSLISGSLIYRFFEDKVEPAPRPAPAPAPVACSDGDRDGVCDTKDQCPKTPAGKRVGPMGCDCDFTLSTHFAFDSAELVAEDMAQLDELAAILKNPKMDFVAGSIDGHTDSTGDEAYNETLSKKRAAAVANYLQSKGVVFSDRLSLNGYGESQPVADNSTEEGRAQNRRVTISRTDCGPAN